MAKRLIDWQEVGSVLKMSKYNGKDGEGNDIPNEELESFQMEDLFPVPEGADTTKEYLSFGRLSEVQKFIFVYGLKQKLADAGSSEKDPKAKALIAREKFDDFVAGKLTAVRANGTGAKANKVLAEKAKAVAEECTLKGLMTKQVLFPETFTEEDQVKLNEFLQMQMEYSLKNGKEWKEDSEK